MLAEVFALSTAGIAFTYAGYPLLLAFAARHRERLAHRGPTSAPVTIVIVAYNEAERIGAKIENCLAQDYPGKLRIVVASDGSDDATPDIVRRYADRSVHLFPFPERRGKAACLNDVLAACMDEFIVFCDVRQRLEPQAVASLLANFADPEVGAVSGELAFESDSVTGFGEGVDAYWRYEKWIRRNEARIDSVIGVSGALYALRRPLWQPIPPQTILDDVLVPMNVVLQGRRVVFEPQAVAWDRASTQAAQEKRRKVRTLAGNFQLLTLRPSLLLPWRNRLFVPFFCHKVLRLVVPLLMVAAFVSNLLIARHHDRLWTLLLLAQVVAYALALYGPRSTALQRRKPVRLLASFFQLNLCVVHGFVEFLTNRNAHRWR